MDCYPKNSVSRSDPNNPVNRFYESFEISGQAADYTSRRGSKILQVIVGWEADGIKSYMAGRQTKFNNNESEINNGTIEAIELLGSGNMAINPTQPPTDPIDAQFKQGWLVLIDVCNDEVLKVPLSQLNKDQNGGKLTFLNCSKIDWGNCYVLFPRAAGIDEANSLVFNIYLR